MTISLLRQIWQRMVEKQPAPRQRLTGFEPLEPRMVLSGFAAMLTPDYFSPPPGDYSHIDRSGAEYAKSVSVEFGRLSDYNTPGSGVSTIVEPRFVGFVSMGPIVAPVAMRDLIVVSKPLDGAVSIDGGSADFVFSNSIKLSTFTADSSFAASGMTMRMEFAPVHKSLIDHVIGDGESDWMATSSSRFDGFMSLASTSLSATGSTLNSVLVSGLVPSSMNAALERRTEAREPATEGAGGAPRSAALDESLAHAAGSETTRSTASTLAIAMLATQSDGLRSSSATGTTESSSSGGQKQGPASSTVAREQSELDAAYAVNRRGLKQKLPGDVTALDETDGEDAELVQVTGDGDVVLLIEAARQFDPAGNAGTQIPELALATMPTDGLIDVLAADVESRTGEHKLLDTGRLVLAEPAMMAYQAFEMVIDRNSQAEGRIADAADVATVAMTEHPVVQVQ